MVIKYITLMAAIYRTNGKYLIYIQFSEIRIKQHNKLININSTMWLLCQTIAEYVKLYTIT